MTNIRRYYNDSYTYFVTNVTFQRQPILLDYGDILRESIDKVKFDTGFDLISWVILPEHFHMLIHPDKINISLVMRRIKLSFSSRYRKMLNITSGQIWQNRFWDHVIRNQDDMNRHIDYIHYNPVKHGLTSKPFDFRYSSIHEYRDDYSDDWGIKENIDTTGEFGE